MNLETGILAVRALNHWRALYPPTYVALRLFLQQIPKSKTSDFLNKYLVRKIVSRNESRYRRFLRFKSINRNGKFDYREMFAPSPSTALSEAFVLQVLSSIPTLSNRSFVYSYRWPKSIKSGSNYSYFLPGYRERDMKVSSLLEKYPNYEVFVYDLRRFYPSVNRDGVWLRLKEHFEQLDNPLPRDFIESTCSSALNIGSNGIPMGPALSHVFGNIAMDQIDREMFQLIGGCYLRYVDDIFLVIPPEHRTTVEAKFLELVASEGMSLNEEKTGRLTSHQWLSTVPQADKKPFNGEFEDIVTKIKVFLWKNPAEFETLKNVFESDGFCMPFGRLVANSRYSRWQWFVNTKKEHKVESVEELLRLAQQLREGFFDRALQIRTSGIPNEGLQRKWIVQELRYILTRLIYLVHIDNYDILLGLSEEIDELYEFQCLMKSITEQKFENILHLAGATSLTLAAICRERNELVRHDILDQNLLQPEGVFDSLSVLSLYGVCSPPKNWLNRLNEHDKMLIEFCLKSAQERRELPDFSYEDEIRTLQLGESADAISKILDTRFSDQENVEFEAFDMAKYGSG